MNLSKYQQTPRFIHKSHFGLCILNQFWIIQLRNAQVVTSSMDVCIQDLGPFPSSVTQNFLQLHPHSEHPGPPLSDVVTQTSYASLKHFFWTKRKQKKISNAFFRAKHDANRPHFLTPTTCNSAHLCTHARTCHAAGHSHAGFRASLAPL